MERGGLDVVATSSGGGIRDKMMPLLLLAGRCVAEVAYEMCPVARRLLQLLSLVNLWAHRWIEVLVRTEEVSLLIYTPS